ncbi:4-hydroxythreonine-4-phosphate dehydrogenase PdxA [Tropicimonas isoalkanivorans]|uniref:4-hydroxythreonine-4-phosphate dehydrogenase n=1 Tax=Tropicimonas isoalkanivorans TaxID=441112 RepID=A0A1I1MSR8_9RHOB|nr:4-hydroxythreonine-4-phosphate dehydrogenase PdxA [Tropicimonas isoalkanivorans]SFC85633.1 4-hydroxythreonine-4-phosphate dehydrogenase [Tropicimonas isoalkanivorans]
MNSIRVAMAIGDAGGISPELAAKVIADPEANTGDLMVLGDRRVLERGAEAAGVTLDLPVVTRDALDTDLPEGSFLVDLGNCDPSAVPVGEASPAAGLASVQNFRAALLAANAGHAGVVFFTPFNKHGMRLAQPDYVDEIGFVDATIHPAESGREFNVLDEVWNARVTSHIPLSEVAFRITEDRVYESLLLTDKVMRGAGFERPRIGVAALNPHAGDGRNFGTEDEDIIQPAIDRARAKQLAVTGPVPSDTVFVRATRGEFDAVMTMYHDQGQIAMKLIGFDRGVTLIANYPFPIVTPAHGTAYDIAGKGIADTGATRNAVNLGRKLARMDAPDHRPEPTASLSSLIARALDPDAVWEKQPA